MYCSLNVVIVMKSRNMRWANHVARTARETCVIYFPRKAGREETYLNKRKETDIAGKRCESVDRIHLAPYRVQDRAFVWAVMYLFSNEGILWWSSC